MANWARGVDFKDSTGTKVFGGVGIYGADTTSQKIYLGYGENYWSTGIGISKTEFTYNNNKVYHAGAKPTPAEIGALSTSANVTSMNGYSGSQPLYNPDSNGILVTTNIKAGSPTMVELRITGNSYGVGDPIDTFVNLYAYTTTQIINYAANAYGIKFDIKAFYHDGVLKLHIPYIAIYQTFRVDIKTSNSYINQAKATLSNEAVPSSGVTALVTIIPKVYYSERRKPTATDVGALPLNGGTLTGSIRYSGGGWTGNAIRFKNADSYGVGMGLGAGGFTVIGSGESSDVVLDNNNSSTETLYLASDQSLFLATNLQNGWSGRKYVEMKTDGELYIGGSNRVYHQGFKPTATDIGAAASSHNHDTTYVKKGELLETTNLDNVSGTYIFTNYYNVNATAANKYPIGEAGSLIVASTPYNSSNQIYHSYNSNRMFIRSGKSSPTERSEWAEIYTTIKKPTAADVGALSTSGGNVTGSFGAKQLGVANSDSNNGYGISLYGGASAGKPSYGLMFQGTATFGSHGSVNGDWATYFTMSGASNRGWIFKHVDTNIASISSTGVFTGTDFRVGTNKVYHQGFKPTAAELGLATSSHNHDSVYSKISESWKTEPKVIAQNTDLNTLLTPGMYASGSDGQSQTITNRPPGTTGFTLEVRLVYNGGESLRRYVQIAIIRNTNTMYIRNRQEIANSTDGQWSAWTKVYGENNKPTAADIGAAASNHTHSYIITADKRAENTSPTAVQAGLFSMFRGNTTDGLSDGGSYHGVLHFRPYGSGTDISGGYTHQMAFTDNGNLWIRTANGADTWRGWNKIYHTGNKPTAADIGAATSSHTHSNYMQQGTLGSSHNLDNLNVNAVYTNPANANATTANKYPIAEAGSLITGIAAYGSTNQMYQTFSSNRLFIRGGGGSTTSKTAWAEVYTTVKKPTLSELGAAAASHSHSNYALIDQNCSNRNFNDIKTTGFYYGYTGMTNAAFQAICVLEVIRYSNDWVVQRQTHIGNLTTYERHFSSANTWSSWVKVYNSHNKPTWNDITGKPGSFFTARNGTTTDLNNKSDGAWTFTQESTTNFPSNLEYKYGVVLNFKSYDDTSYGGGSILISHSNSRDLMFRGMYHGDNQPWRKVWHDGNFDAKNPAVSSLVSTGAITGGTGSTFHGDSWFAKANVQEIKPNGTRWISMIGASKDLGMYFNVRCSYGQADLELNGDGLINGAYHALLAPNSGNYSFCGSDEQYFTSMYARAFVTKSDKKIKTKIAKYESENILDDILDLVPYEYNTLAQATKEGIVENKNDINLGIMVQDAPIEIVDESETGINLYSYTTYICSIMVMT